MYHSTLGLTVIKKKKRKKGLELRGTYLWRALIFINANPLNPEL